MHPLPMAAGRCLLRAGPPYHLAGAPDLLPVGVCSILAIRAGKKIFPLSTEKLVSWLFHRTAETSGCVVVVAGLVGTNGLVTVGLCSCWGFSSAREKHLSLSLLSPHGCPLSLGSSSGCQLCPYRPFPACSPGFPL